MKYSESFIFDLILNNKYFGNAIKNVTMQDKYFFRIDKNKFYIFFIYLYFFLGLLLIQILCGLDNP